MISPEKIWGVDGEALLGGGVDTESAWGVEPVYRKVGKDRNGTSKTKPSDRKTDQ